MDVRVGLWRKLTAKEFILLTVVLEKTPESPLDCKEIQPVNPKGNQSWMFIGRTDAKTEALILWLPGAKIWFIRKDPDAGKDWKQKEKRAAEDELDWITDSMDMNLSRLWETMKDREAWHVTVHVVTRSWTWLRGWTTTKTNLILYKYKYSM